MKKRLVVVCFMVLAGTNAHAYTSADELAKHCTAVPTKPEEAFKRIECLGYVGGVLDTYGLLSGLYPTVRVYCAPKEGMTIETALNSLVQWARKSSENANTPARSALIFALKDRYPCK